MSPAELGEYVAIAMVFCTFGILLLGFPVAFSLAGGAVIFAAIGSYLQVFDWPMIFGVTSRIYGTMISETLVAIPLFVFMGVMLEKSRIAEQLLETMGQLFGGMSGGLGVSVVIVGALLAASTGIVGATVVTMGLISLPAMLRAGYDKGLASGIICSSGALAQVIPPSTVLILVADQLQGSYMEANMAMGNFAAAPVSATDLFAGAMVPGLLLAGLYALGIFGYAVWRPQTCPPVPMSEGERGRLLARVVKVMLPPLCLIVAVLGSILSGVATASESASVGAVGAIVLALFHGKVNLTILREVCRSTLLISTMIFVILIGATVFSLVFRGLGGEKIAEDVLSLVPGGLRGATFVVLLTIFVLGFFLDTFEIIFIVTPIFSPILFKMGADPVFLGVAMALVLQASYITPPFGFAIFYLQGTTNKLRTTTIYRGLVPFILIQIVMVLVVVRFPELATWLPRYLFGG